MFFNEYLIGGIKINNKGIKLNAFNKRKKYLFKDKKAKLKVNTFKMAKSNKPNIAYIKTILV